MVDIAQLLLEQILRIDPSHLFKYSAVQDQLLYLILIPNVILILFIVGFTGAIAGAHKGMRNLLAIVVYLFFILGGWYGSFLIPLTITYFKAMLVFGILIFVLAKFFHPTMAKGGGRAAAGAIGGFFKKRREKLGGELTKAKRIEELRKDIIHKDRLLQDLDRKITHAEATPGLERTVATLSGQRTRVQEEKLQLEREIQRLEEHL
jgi:membrane-bound ClpP family serine protease